MELPQQCPLCGGSVVIVAWECEACGTAFQGRFAPPQLPAPFDRLSPEQLHFLLVFLRHEGKLSRMEQELGMSYPTLRNRLRTLLQQLGLKPAPTSKEQAQAREERLRILEDLEAERISVDEAVRRLRALSES